MTEVQYTNVMNVVNRIGRVFSQRSIPAPLGKRYRKKLVGSRRRFLDRCGSFVTASASYLPGSRFLGVGANSFARSGEGNVRICRTMQMIFSAEWVSKLSE